jgi:hypothetical protein
LFVRKVKTRSGATAVQIAHTRRGVQTILEHIGSAHDDVQLAALAAIAKSKIHAGQLAFDLDALIPTAPTGVAPTVVGSRSRVLWDVLTGVYGRLGFEAAVDDDVFMKLVLARVVEPTSKADTIRVWRNSGFRRPGFGRSGAPSRGVLSRTGETSSPPPPTRTRPATGTCRWCSTTSPPSTSKPKTKTICGRWE